MGKHPPKWLQTLMYKGFEGGWVFGKHPPNTHQTPTPTPTPSQSLCYRAFASSLGGWWGVFAKKLLNFYLLANLFYTTKILQTAGFCSITMKNFFPG